MLMRGSRRSSQRGSHQLAPPSRCIRAGHQQRTQDEGVEGDGGGQADAEHGDDPVAAEDEGEEDGDHDDRRGVDHAAGLGEADPDRPPVVAGLPATPRTSG